MYTVIREFTEESELKIVTSLCEAEEISCVICCQLEFITGWNLNFQFWPNTKELTTRVIYRFSEWCESYKLGNIIVWILFQKSFISFIRLQEYKIPDIQSILILLSKSFNSEISRQWFIWLRFTLHKSFILYCISRKKAIHSNEPISYDLDLICSSNSFTNKMLTFTHVIYSYIILSDEQNTLQWWHLVL